MRSKRRTFVSKNPDSQNMPVPILLLLHHPQGMPVSTLSNGLRTVALSNHGTRFEGRSQKRLNGLQLELNFLLFNCTAITYIYINYTAITYILLLPILTKPHIPKLSLPNLLLQSQVLSLDRPARLIQTITTLHTFQNYIFYPACSKADLSIWAVVLPSLGRGAPRQVHRPSASS